MCLVGCLATSLVSTHEMLVTVPSRHKCLQALSHIPGDGEVCKIDLYRLTSYSCHWVASSPTDSGLGHVTVSTNGRPTGWVQPETWTVLTLQNLSLCSAWKPGSSCEPVEANLPDDEICVAGLPLAVLPDSLPIPDSCCLTLDGWMSSSKTRRVAQMSMTLTANSYPWIKKRGLL